MSVKVESGVWQTVWQPKKTATTFTKGEFVDLVSGFVQPCTASSKYIFGVNQDNVYTTSDTTTVLIPVLVPRHNGIVRATATTLATTDVGNQVDLTDSLVVDDDTSTTDALTCQGYISATEGLFSFTFPNMN